MIYVKLKTDGNERKIGNGNRSRTARSKNGSGINGNTKIGKYDRKIDGNER
jgi:hypothetical protein